MIGDLTQMEAQVNVDENDIGSIAIGQSAEIQVDALPDHTLHGVVSEISNSANSSGNGTTEQKTEFAIKIAHHGSAEGAAPRHDGQRRGHHEDGRQGAERSHPERGGPYHRSARDEG